MLGGSINRLVSELLLISLIGKLIRNDVMVEWNVRKKRWWFGYGFRGGEDHVDYTYGLYWWGAYQMFSSNSWHY